ncbi:peptidoglycan-binding domain-containing protein [Streptomyces sp. H27-C3]|uniref:peptidoglycan-binding domain-containing protein n=1 Tax=Streptomyces sp. H27-C3 TaxID=3046305 RepID=UPI0024B9FDA3|nr:peptidoglycan-binding domain-containing protein [Streptomyces sp. H27-C3]MDJ0462895.1 peptidoglycan-binding domain-containing protein [Streptomyces sp. H27-C3]
MSGHICPGCGTDRGAASGGDGPGCGCAERAVEAARAARAAEIAAAEDFDPLRIRPYVTLPEPDAQDDDVRPGDTGGDAGGDGGADGDGDGDGDGRGASGGAYPDRVVAPDGLGGPAGPGAALPTGAAGSAGSTMPMGLVGPGGGSSAADPAPARPPGPAEEPPVPRRGRPALWAAVAGGVAAATVGALAIAGGLSSTDIERDRALPPTVTSAPGPSDDPVAPASASAPADRVSRTPSAPAAASRSASPSPSRTSSATPAPSASKALPPPSPPAPSTAQATGTVETSPEPAADALNLGDSGPEVVELQDRLGQVWLYYGPDDGSYSADVEQAVRTYQSYMSIEGDPEGSYGPHTRRVLEASTDEPGRT